FLAERVLGNVVSSGIKVMVLAVIVGIGSNFFTDFTDALQGQEPDIGQALSLMLASLTMFGLGIFGPAIASGLVSGAPQLGAGAALGTAVGAAGITMLAGGAAAGGARALGGAALGAVRSGTAMGSAASTAYQLGKETAASPSVGAGLGGVARAAGNAARSRVSGSLILGEAAAGGRQAAWSALNQNSTQGSSAPSSGGPGGGGETGGTPAWRSAQRYGRTPPPETPYQRAGQLWDDRIGAARVQARNWRLMAFGCLALTAGTSAGLAWQSLQSRVMPYVVEVDRLGEARAIEAADVEYRPTDPQVAWHLSHFITNVRSVSLDPVLMRRDWLEAYDFTTKRGAQFLGEYARSASPFANVGERTVSVQVTSVVRASDKSFQVKWTETAFERGSQAGTSRWT
ncbi:hypothetical protein LTR94_026780, partial [Friedmanniomyces endolithicus]